MSLVNDALKRAKDAQQKSPRVAAGPEFRPAELAPAARISRSLGPTTPILILLIVCSGLILLLMIPWHKSPETRPAEIKASARVNPVTETTPPARIGTVAIPAAAVKPAVAVQPPVQPTTTAPVNIPASLKLQAIFFVPGRSSAIISSKTVRVGDSLQGFRVAAINQASITLVSTTQTNVMKLEEK